MIRMSPTKVSFLSWLFHLATKNKLYPNETYKKNIFLDNGYYVIIHDHIDIFANKAVEC